jgi:hypothetical protein
MKPYPFLLTDVLYQEQESLSYHNSFQVSTNSLFVPNSSQWKTITLELPDTLTGEIQIGFDWGSFLVTNKLKGLYLDDIRILGGTSGVPEQMIVNGCNVFPNPANEFIYFDFSNALPGKADIFIYSTTGILLQKICISHSTELQIPVDDIGSDGMYFYTVRTSEQQFFAGKFIIQR